MRPMPAAGDLKMKLSKFIAVLALTATAAFPALAADIIEEIPPVEPAPLPVASGWYLRGDVGYVFKSKGKGDWDFWNQFPGVQGIDDTYRYDKIDLGDAAGVGVGVGYRVNEFFRTDATLDYFRPDVSTRTECPFMIKADAAHALPFGSDCHYDGDGKADVLTAMANAYVDLPYLGWIVPYVGAGIGAAYVDYGDVNYQEDCAACKPSYVRYEATHNGEDDWRFASSLMAGASIDLTSGLKLDAGYKYTRIFEGDALGYDDADRAAGASGVQVRDDGFNIHSVRVGLRYEFF